ncbi:hypothetical protein RGQ15_09550 [Paracoccus sp. MBLB3053]|uniref:Uncharacterized protein n=1 Tax=Paracoccus aurantius TaxID=3073814 RepID=A0ABU2HRZ0_9RHOB|nr:hypothetical protein [Paracoccus sp. MBLB3053]MDS9467811.1 hypothetical protein [Paracoccus sp. MBLB3053]
MASFVEQATLRVNDQSTKSLQAINKELAKLFKTAGNARGIKIPGLDERSLRNINRELLSAARQLERSSRNPFRPLVRDSQQVRNNFKATQQEINRLANKRLRVNLTLQGFAANMLGGAAASIGAQMARGFQQGLGSFNAAAGRGALNMDTVRTAYGTAGYTDEQTASVERMAGRVSAAYPVASQAGLMEAFRDANTFDLGTTDGAAKAEDLMNAIARDMAVIQAATGKTADAASDQARMMEKSLNLLGQQGPQAQAYREAMLQASIASGGDLDMANVYRMLQQSPQLKNMISPETLLQIALNRDSAGSRGTGQIDQLISDLTRGNLNAEDTAAQQAIGLRDRQGRSTIAADFGRDFNATVRDEIIPLLRKDNIDLTDASAISSYLDNKLGLSKQGGISALTDAIMNLDANTRERDRALKTNPQYAITNPSFKSMREALNSQVENLGATALTPLMPAAKAVLDAATDAVTRAGNNPAAAGAALLGVNAALTSAPVLGAMTLSAITSRDPIVQTLGVIAQNTGQIADNTGGIGGKDGGWMKGIWGTAKKAAGAVLTYGATKLPPIPYAGPAVGLSYGLHPTEANKGEDQMVSQIYADYAAKGGRPQAVTPNPADLINEVTGPIGYAFGDIGQKVTQDFDTAASMTMSAADYQRAQLQGGADDFRTSLSGIGAEIAGAIRGALASFVPATPTERAVLGYGSVDTGTQVPTE